MNWTMKKIAITGATVAKDVVKYRPQILSQGCLKDKLLRQLCQLCLLYRQSNTILATICRESYNYQWTRIGRKSRGLNTGIKYFGCTLSDRSRDRTSDKDQVMVTD